MNSREVFSCCGSLEWKWSDDFGGMFDCYRNTIVSTYKSCKYWWYFYMEWADMSFMFYSFRKNLLCRAWNKQNRYEWWHLTIIMLPELASDDYCCITYLQVVCLKLWFEWFMSNCLFIFSLRHRQELHSRLWQDPNLQQDSSWT